MDDLGLSIKKANDLSKAGIYTIEDLTTKTERELFNTAGISSESFVQIRRALVKRGLSLKSDLLVDNWGLTFSAVNELNRAGIHTIEDLTTKTARELSKLGISSQNLDKIKTAVGYRELSLTPDPDPLVDNLGLSVQIANNLDRAGIHTIEDLTKKTARELSKLGISSQNLDEIKTVLGYRDLSLTPDPLVDDLGLSIWAANVIAKGNVFDLGLSSQTVQILNKAGIHTVEDLVRKTITELSKLDGIDSESFGEITKIFSKMGLDSST